MELGQESPKSNLEYVKEDKAIETQEKIEDFDVNGESINGAMINLSTAEDKMDEEANEPIGSPSMEPQSIGSPPNSNLEVNSAPVKGYGLKKWRRIRRDLNNKDISEDVDSLVVLKRHLSLSEPKKARDDSRVKNVVEEEAGSPTPSVQSLRAVEAVGGITLDPELAQLVSSGGFSIGMDPDNSDDRGSKSSTATSFPKPRHEIGFGRERMRTKNVGGKGGHASQQRSQRGKGSGLDTGKKIQGDRIRLEKGNSPSSIESDLRSSNMGVLRWGGGVTDGGHGEKPLNFDGDEARIGEEGRSGYHKENGTVEELLRQDLDTDLLNGERKGIRGNFRPPSGIDPFIESIVMLEAAQEALETEIQKIGEIGKAAALDDFDDQSEETEVSCSASPEHNLLELTRKMEHLQYKLEEASTIAQAKELKVIELEEVINRTQLIKNRTGGADVIEFEIEAMLRNKIQVEIEFLVISRTTLSWKVLAEDRIALLEEKNMHKIRDAEDKAMKLKIKANELESYCEELLKNERVLKLKKEVCKFSVCSFIQLLLFCLALGLFLIQLMPPSDEFVPT